MTQLVLAQIGCGYWGPNLLRNLVALPGCQVKWVAEADAARRQYVRTAAPGVGVTADWEEVLQDPDVDGVVVATPPSTHYAQAGALLEAGKHVLCEKPLTLDVAQAKELGALAKRQGKTLMVGHTFLFNDAVRYIKARLDDGELGNPIYLSSQRLNLGQVRDDVDVWWNLAPHDLSILLYLRGGLLPSSLACHGVHFLRPDIADAAFATLSWEDGVVAHLHMSWLDPRKVRRLTLVGDKKMLVYDDVASDKITIYDRGVDKVPAIGTRMDYDTPVGFKLLQRSGDVLLPRIQFREPLAVEVAHFVECIRTGAAPLTGAEHACDVVKLLAAGERSLQRAGAPVDPRADA